MPKMKTTLVDSRPKLPAAEHADAEDSSGENDSRTVTYEKKGKKKAPERPPNLWRKQLHTVSQLLLPRVAAK